MRTIMVRYQTTPAHADRNEELVRAVFEALHSGKPAGLRYASYRLADRVSFVHIATVERPEQNPLTSLPAFKAFQEGLKERLVEPPVVTELPAIASYDGLA